MTVWYALIVSVVLIAGVATILVTSLWVAATLAEKINPKPDLTNAQEAIRAAESHLTDLKLKAIIETLSAIRNRPRTIDSSHVTIPVFGYSFVVLLLTSTWGSVWAHGENPDEGLPLGLTLLPLWVSLWGSVFVAFIARTIYRTRHRHLPDSKRREGPSGRQTKP